LTYLNVFTIKIVLIISFTNQLFWIYPKNLNQILNFLFSVLKNKNNFLYNIICVAQVTMNYIYYICKKIFKVLIRTKVIPKASSICYTLYIVYTRVQRYHYYICLFIYCSSIMYRISDFLKAYTLRQNYNYRIHITRT